MPIVYMQGIETWTFALRQGGPTGALGNLQHSNTQDRTYTLPDKDGVVAMLSDLPLGNPEGLQVLSQTVTNGISSVPSYIPAYIMIGNTLVALGSLLKILSGLESISSQIFIGNLQGQADTVKTIPNLTGDITSIGNETLLSESGVTPGTYNDSPSTLTPFTVDAKGRITVVGEPIDISTDAETIILSQAMPALTCFRIDGNGQAFIVTSNDSSLPLIEGMTLEAGGIGSTVNVARIRNKAYVTPFYQSIFQIYWLLSNGNISSIRPIDTAYQVMIGHSIPNSSSIVFDPQLPIKLAN